MKSVSSAIALFAAVSLVSCSGGGGTPAPSPSPTPAPAPTPTATLSVTVTPTEKTFMSQEGAVLASPEDLVFEFDASFSGTTTDPIVVDLDYDTDFFSAVTITEPSADAYRVRLEHTASEPLIAGVSSGEVRFRLCTSDACDTVYPGSTQTYSYTWNVDLQDWTTFQRNARHDGYVSAEYDPDAIAELWEFSAANVDMLTPVATADGRVFVTADLGGGEFAVLALDDQTGAEDWSYSIGTRRSAGAPAYSDGKLVVTSMVRSAPNNENLVLDASDGSFVRTSEFGTQWADFPAPTPWGDNYYTSEGYYDAVINSYRFDQDAAEWTSSAPGYDVWSFAVPAVDEDNIYFYSENLEVFDRGSGALIMSISNPNHDWRGYDYGAATVLGTNRSVIAYSGTVNTSTAFGASGLTHRPLIRYNVDLGTIDWQTTETYFTQPAVANGVVYAARISSTPILDAIDEDTGSVLWTYTPTSTDSAENFVGNTVVTENLLFFSSRAKVYALDLVTQQIVWEHDRSGWIAMGPGHKLYIINSTPGSSLRSDGTITAYSLVGN